MASKCLEHFAQRHAGFVVNFVSVNANGMGLAHAGLPAHLIALLMPAAPIPNW